MNLRSYSAMIDKKYRPGGKSYLCVNDDSKLVVNAEYLIRLKERA